MLSSEILDEDRRVRIDAVRALPLDQHGIFALRSALATDDDGEVRGLAAERLALADVARSRSSAARAARLTLVDATADRSPFVRERAVLALARHYEGADAPRVEARVEEMTRLEPSWHVRRAAVRAIAQIAGERALRILDRALDDPFWRVRYAAIQALAKLDHARLEPGGSERRRAALAFLREGGASEVEPAAPDRSFADGPLDDEDPAVVAAHLARTRDADVDGETLVAMLASPHDVLRQLARRRLVKRANDDELRLVLALLDDPRVPYVDEAARRVLARATSQAFRARVLAHENASPAALVWAIEESPPGPDAIPFTTHASVLVRRAAFVAAANALSLEALESGARDPDDGVRATCIGALGARAHEDVRAAACLDALDFATEAPSVARAGATALIAAIAKQPGCEVALHRAAVAVEDPAARSLAIASATLTGEERAKLQTDDDPWVRLAALDVERASHALANDPDPWVRRGAFELLAARPTAATLAVAVASDDPWIRSRAALALSRTEPVRAIESLLRLTRDRSPMVRASAAETLANHDGVAAACHALVAGDIDEELRLAAHGRLVREGDQRAFDALARDLEDRELSTSARYALLGMALAYPEAIRGRVDFDARSTTHARRSSKPIADVARRPLGETGMLVAPLGISGAHDLPLSQLERAREAGVNLFFWEPEYRSLEALIANDARKEDLVVVCGTYEADAKTIERDIDRALRRLKLDTLGVMLLFWVRSPARLSDEAFGALTRAKEKGKVRAIGFSTHLRELAATAIVERPWDVVMARLSAAHPALETTLLPVARERNVGVIAFSALVYGRMLASREISAPDCYRYTLTQPGVSACLSAPRRQRELEENLAVLSQPTLDPTAEARLREHGKRVRAENRSFLTLVRGP